MQWKTTFQSQETPGNRLLTTQIEGTQKQVRLRCIYTSSDTQCQLTFFATVLKLFSNAYNFVLLVHSEVKPVEEHQANKTGTQTGR